MDDSRDLWIVDVEQFANFHSLCAIRLSTKERRDFVIHESRDDRIKYLAWLKNCEGWITFNGIHYDYPLIHHILENKSFFINNSIDKVVKWLKRKSDNIINRVDPPVWESESHILQYDLFKINHYDRPQKSCSLKWLEFSLKWNNLEDLPFAPGSVIEAGDIQKIVDYNYNDVEATLMFWNYCSKAIELRKNISATYNINATNMSDTSIGKNILARYYSDFTGIEYDKFKDYRDTTYIVKLRDVISNKISFDTPELQSLLRELKNSDINLLNTKFHKLVEFDGVKYEMGKGGLHTKMPAGVFEESEDSLIVDMDYASYYPGLMLFLKIYPPQLGIEILNILKILTEQRLEAKANGDKSTADSLKLTINSLFGLMGSKHSFMYSPQSLLKVTINGQLFLLMFIEKITKESGAKCFYANTDGSSFIVNKDRVQDFYKAAKEFEQVLDIKQEFDRYEKCFIRDVNNYIIVKKGGSIKRKGAFELPSDQLPHKNNSKGIVSIAVDRYVVDGIPVEQTIKNHLSIRNGYRPVYDDNKLVSYEIPANGIYDFLIGIKAKRSPKRGRSKYILKTINKGYIKEEELQKVNRFYISNTGGKIIKTYNDGTNQLVVANRVKENVLNKVHDPYDQSYDIDYSWYIKEADKLIKEVDKNYKNQKLSLF
jgi:hypothetical protein